MTVNGIIDRHSAEYDRAEDGRIIGVLTPPFDAIKAAGNWRIKYPDARYRRFVLTEALADARWRRHLYSAQCIEDLLEALGKIDKYA